MKRTQRDLVVVGAFVAITSLVLIGSLLYQLAPMDPVTLLVAAGLLLGVAVLAAAVPAIRASRLDPARVLRES